MNLFFKHFHKTPFWSQLLFGMVAIFALPEIHAINAESEHETVINQSLVEYTQATADTEQQSLFIATLNDKLNNPHLEMPMQAVIFCEFFAKCYRLDKQNVYPIRAGPLA